MEVFIVQRSDGYVVAVYDNSVAASNYCLRCNEKDIYHSYSWEPHDLDSGDGIGDYIYMPTEDE